MRHPSFYRGLKPGEITLVRKVFTTSLPPINQIGIGDGLGAGDNIWTDVMRGGDDMKPEMRYAINLGDFAAWDMSQRHWCTGYDDYSPGVLCHEMTHVWQFYHGQSVKLRSIWAQTVGAGYKFKAGDPWIDYNVEQRAQIVEMWVANGLSEDDELYPYIHFIIQGPHGKRWQHSSLAELKGYWELEHGPKVTEETSAPYRVSQNESAPPITDSYLISLLEKRFAANDVAGFGGRVRELEQVFGSMGYASKLALHGRLSLRRPGDKVAEYFHANLSKLSQDNLLKILLTPK